MSTLANILLDLLGAAYLLTSPLALLALAFQIWMLVDAIRRREWLWAVLIGIGFFLSALLYYFAVYRNAQSGMRGFELPGQHDRRRIKELQAQIHHLDKAHHHSQLGDIYFQQGKLARAEACYRAALQRDPDDADTLAHLGQCLLRQKRPADARPLLERVIARDPKHDYGHTMMALAETLGAVGETDAALGLWRQVTEQHSYARARVQLAELLLARNLPDEARRVLTEVLEDDPHTPAFQRQRDRVWVRRAKALLRRLD